MIRVASGEKLPITQADVTTKGWSFECRVYAEDPLRNFLPSVGTLTTYRPPTTEVCAPAAAAAALASGGADAAALAADCHLGIVRVDDGIVEGGEISVNYDPMVAKLITRAPTREAARLVMLEALDRYAIRGAGLRHNINFLRTLMDHPRFAAGQLTTAFIPGVCISPHLPTHLPHISHPLMAFAHPLSSACSLPRGVPRRLHWPRPQRRRAARRALMCCRPPVRTRAPTHPHLHHRRRFRSGVGNAARRAWRRRA